MSAAPVTSVFQRWGRRGTAIVLGLSSVVLLLIGATVGLAIGGSLSSSSPTIEVPASNSVDVGFLRDMTVHHEQGVLLAHIAQGNGGSSDVAGLAYDIEYQQTSQIGQMGGFLLLWDRSLNNLAEPMAWMTDSSGAMAGSMSGAASGAMGGMSVDPAAAADGAVMPGMATNTEIAKLKTLRGSASDILFLQLMIRHHQGGVPMMQYATAHATNPVVLNMAKKMADSQVAEIASMTQVLDETFHASPLPAPGMGSMPPGTSSGPASGSTSGSSADDMPGMTGMTSGMAGLPGMTGMTSGMAGLPGMTATS